MMRRYATLRGLRRLLLPVPVLTPASLRDVAGARHAGPGAGRPRAGGRAPEPTVVRSYAAREAFTDRADAARRGADGGDGRTAGAHWKMDTRTMEVNAPPARAFAPDPSHRRQQRLVLRQPAVEDAGPDRSVDGRDWDGRPAPRSGSLHGRRRDRRLDGGRLRARRSHAPPRRPEAAGAWLAGVQVTPLDGGRRSRICQTARFDPKGILGVPTGTPCCRSTPSSFAASCGGSRSSPSTAMTLASACSFTARWWPHQLPPCSAGTNDPTRCSN